MTIPDRYPTLLIHALYRKWPYFFSLGVSQGISHFPVTQASDSSLYLNVRQAGFDLSQFLDEYDGYRKYLFIIGLINLPIVLRALSEN